MVVVVRLRQLVGEAVVEGVAVPLLQLAHSVAQRVLLLRQFLPSLRFLKRPRLPKPRMRTRRLLQPPAVEAAVQDVVVAAEEAQLLPQRVLQQRQRPVQRCRSLFIARARFEL